MSLVNKYPCTHNLQSLLKQIMNKDSGWGWTSRYTVTPTLGLHHRKAVTQLALRQKFILHIAEIQLQKTEISFAIK